jgi:hypothetical protein
VLFARSFWTLAGPRWAPELYRKHPDLLPPAPRQ